VTVFLEPGTYVRHPDCPDWGIGQIQTVVRQRVTVNFENAGKQLINTAVIALVVLDDDLK
jgi:transcription elongation factor GreA-like protein